jgi:hypothetical protein
MLGALFSDLQFSWAMFLALELPLVLLSFLMFFMLAYVLDAIIGQPLLRLWRKHLE